MSKGDETRAAILEAGVDVAAAEGLEALTIGRLADRVGMSKSGLFAHFRSKEALQLAVLEHGRVAFTRAVAAPALEEPRGEPRLRALVDGWLGWNSRGGRRKEPCGGCLFLQAAAEYDDREGAVRDALVQIQRDLQDFLTRAVALCVEEGHFRKTVEPEQFTFELYAMVMAHHFHARLLDDRRARDRAREGVERLFASAR